MERRGRLWRQKTTRNRGHRAASLLVTELFINQHRRIPNPTRSFGFRVTQGEPLLLRVTRCCFAKPWPSTAALQ